MNILKTKTLIMNVNVERKFLMYGKEIDELESFCYLGSIIDKSGGSSAEVASRIYKVRNAFAQLNPVWKSSYISRRTKIKSTLLYACETWNMAPRDF